METTENIKVVEVVGDKSRYMSLLLLGDESESMIGRYLDCSNLYVGASAETPVAVCAVLSVDAETVEVKNLAVRPEFRRRGIGAQMLRFVEDLHPGKTVILGTGETPSTLRFYFSCGYTYSHRVPGFFTDNYPDPIVEEGVRLCDMVYLKKRIQCAIFD